LAIKGTAPVIARLAQSRVIDSPHNGLLNRRTSVVLHGTLLIERAE